MGTRDTLKSRLYRGAAVFALGTASWAVPANALQEEDADVDSVDVAEEMAVDEVVVTGSRLARVGIDTIRPNISVDSTLLEKRAFTNIADALNEVPAFGGGVDPSGDQNAFTVGQNFVDLFNLGTQRTLTLVNGRRFVSSNTPTLFGSAGGLQVDLNAVPVALLERVEVVPLAGSAVYGSDAIAGAVNVILRDDYEGFEASAQYGVTEEGDGQTYQAQSVFGTNFADDRGNIVVSVEYNEQEGLLRTERPDIISNRPVFVNFGNLDLDGDGEPDDVSGDGLPNSFRRVVDGGQRVQLVSPGGSISPTATLIPSLGVGALADGNFYEFAPDGSLETCEPGETPAGSPFFAFGGTCGTADFFDQVEQIRSPLERIVVSSIAHYDIADNLRFNQEFFFSNSKAEELVNQGGFQTFAFSGTSGPLTVSADNPFLTDQARGVLESNGLDQFVVSRFNNDLVNGGSNSTENHTWRYVGGLEGDFDIGDRNFFWDASAVFGNSDVETRSFGIVDGRFVNALDAVRLNEESLQPVTDSLTSDLNGDGAIDVNDALIQFQNNGSSGVSDLALGEIVCQANIDLTAGQLDGFNEPVSGSGITSSDRAFVDGCIPIDIFGEGAASREAQQFINGGPAITSSDIAQRVFTANVGGDVVDLPAGALGIALGFETRRERADFTPGLGAAVQLNRSAPFTPTRGELETTEFYGETAIPLISPEMDIPGANLIELNASTRRVRNEVTDPVGDQNSQSDWTYEIGGRYSPVEDITFRGTYASAIRTPSLVELFTPEVQIFTSGVDPCDGRFINDGPNPDVRRANCVAAGIDDPDNFTSNIANATIIASSSGNPNLIPERSKSWTVGAVIEPRWVPGLTVTADYFNIDINDRIENFGFEELAETCFDSTDFPNVAACDQFQRNDAGQVVDVQEGFVNAASSEFEAISFRAQYNFGLADFVGLFDEESANSDLGNLNLDLNMMHRITQKVQVVPTRPADEEVGGLANPEWEGTFDVTWNYDKWRFFYRMTFTDRLVFDPSGNGTITLNDQDEIITSTRERFIHNTSLSYEVVEGTTVQVAVDNLFNRTPNRFERAFNRITTTELLGRRFTFNIRTRF